MALNHQSVKKGLKMAENDTQKELETLPDKEGRKVSPRKLIRTTKDAKRALGKLIRDFQQGLVQGTDAKTMCYLLISFCQMVKDHEIEERIAKIEEQVKAEREAR